MYNKSRTEEHMKTKVMFDSQGGIDIELRGTKSLVSMRRHLILEPFQVEKVEIVNNQKRPKLWSRVMGSNLIFYGGWFRENGENEFWSVKDFSRVLVITARDFKYKKIYIEVDKNFSL
jgi:hypothetical protein